MSAVRPVTPGDEVGPTLRYERVAADCAEITSAAPAQVMRDFLSFWDPNRRGLAHRRERELVVQRDGALFVLDHGVRTHPIVLVLAIVLALPGGAEIMAAQRSPPEAATRRCVADGCMVSKTANSNDAAASPIRPHDEDDRKCVRDPPRRRP